MIYIKNQNTFEKLETWEELEKRDGFQSIVDLTGKKLMDAFGYYELANKIPCGKKNCRTKHFKGVLVVTEDGIETNIGHDCGFAAFGVKFEQLATELTNQANYHRLLVAVKEAKSQIFSLYQKKAILEAGQPSLLIIANQILNARRPEIIGRAAYVELKRMAGSNDGRVKISRRKSDSNAELEDVMSQKGFSDYGDELKPKKPQYEDVVIGNVQHSDCLLDDYDISILFERDIKLVLEDLQQSNPDEITQRKLTRLGVRVSRFDERLNFIRDRLMKARVFLTQENLKPLYTKLNLQRSVSQKDKDMFLEFILTLPERASLQA
ncbi:hypothetical protein V2154_10605 [Ewingella sp. CoE-038-23]|uniref:hypothetical protein n=1 Tax=Ewingella docleensis TaxID=3118588 RepID=UPI0033656B18